MEKIRRRPFDEKDRQDVQEEVISLVESEPEKLIALYDQLDRSYRGRYINSDLMKEVLPHFGSKEERSRYNAVVHNSAAVLAGEVFRRELEEDRRAGHRGKVVTLVTGVPGAGKSTVIQESMDAKMQQGENIPLMYEGQMANAEAAMEKVQQVLDAGFQPRIVVVHNTATRALDNTLKRFEETGRGGSINLLATIQGNLPEVLKKIEEKHGNAVQLVVLDYRDPEKRLELRGWQHRHVLESEGNYERIKERLSEHLEQRKREGRIGPAAESQAKGNSGNNPRGLYGSNEKVGQQSGTGTPDHLGHDRKARGSSKNRRVLEGSPRRRSPINSPEKVTAALSYVDPRDRDKWVRMAFAVKDGLGDGGFDTWDQWSRGATSYNKEAAKAVWRSARSGPITVSSLYYEAKQNGYKIESDQIQQIKEKSVSRDTGRGERHRREAQAAAKAHRVLAASSVVEADHPYLARKNVSLDGLREIDSHKLKKLLGYAPKQNGDPLAGRILVLPVHGEQELLTTLEFIDEAGRKSALAGGRKAGARVSVSAGNEISKEIYISEGVATAISIKQALGSDIKVVAALSDTNLKNVAIEIRAQHPDGKIVICADSGSEKKAIDAAQAVQGYYVVPSFSKSKEEGFHQNDFNDLMVLEGADQVKKQLGDLRQPHLNEGKNFNVASSMDVERAATVASGNAVNHVQKGVNMAEESAVVMDQEVAKKERKPVGDYVMQLKDVPQETRDLAKSYFGARTNIYAAKENGGPYKGEVYNTEKYLIQEIGNRSVVIHDKSKMDFPHSAVKWMNENQKLNGHELQVYYEKDKPTALPYDRHRDNLERSVASLKKSARELGMEGAEKTLDELKAKSWDRMKEIRKVEEAKKTMEKEARKEAVSPEAEKKAPGPKR